MEKTFLSYLTLNNITTLKSKSEVAQVIGNGTIPKLGYAFLFAVCSSYGRNLDVCEIFSVKEWRDLENWFRGC